MNVLYLSWTGLAEPLGQSQVLAYLKLLAREHRITLLSMEKPEDAADAALMAELRRTCEAHGIRWMHGRYHRRPRLIARAYDYLCYRVLAARLARETGAELIHARSYIAASVAEAVARRRRLPFIFDMRSLWPEELIVAGRLRRGSTLHRAILRTERRLLRRAAGVVSLTRAAVDWLCARHPALPADRFVVIPTCADLDRFRPPAAPRGAEPRRLGTVGSVASGWFLLPWLFAFFRAAEEDTADAEFHIVSRDAPEGLARAAREAGFDPARLRVHSRRPAEVPAALGELQALAMFFRPGVAKLGSCPTRMAEALGCGIPVVANAGVGDVAAVVREHRVGVVVEEASPAAMGAAVVELRALLADPDTPARCRRTAEALFSVESGAAAYARLYARAAARPWSAEQ